MDRISQRQERVMLAIWALKGEAYLVAIRKYLSELTGRSWTLSALHTPLRQLEKAGLLDSILGEATAIRGGRAKRIYRITDEGLQCLADSKKLTDALWGDFDGQTI